jgi:prepilin-type N-terminal cleavage/methylation domain-containing protein/prepilin-type processing-associated H-X9-DG protein
MKGKTMNYIEKRIRHKERAFTLIELLVVIAIIAVLLAILLPAMRKIKEMGREQVCKSNLRNIGLAVHLYLDDYNRTLPDTKNANEFLWYERTGGRANILWLDGHVSAIEETTGDDVEKRWYTGDKP